MVIGKTKKMIEQKEKELYQYMSNNYKDEALRCFKEYEELLRNLVSEGKLSQKDYEKFTPKIEGYRRTFKNYHH
ncbi:hypothetical protein ACTNBM_01305 [Lachnospiraceae bacterium HCP1S3_C3]|nr:hypothetical protein [Lachnospiraceae bacterium]MDD6858188.1 hypothetical protein [Lachnospiraceae bacterium]